MEKYQCGVVTGIVGIILSISGLFYVTGTNNFVYGQLTNQTFVEDELGGPTWTTTKEILQYCRFVNDYGANDGKEDISGDLVDTGKISTVYKDWTCDDAEEHNKKFQDLQDSLDDMIALMDSDK